MSHEFRSPDTRGLHPLRHARYHIDVALLDHLRCDFVVHGDDLPTRTDGKGLCVRVARRTRSIPRVKRAQTPNLTPMPRPQTNARYDEVIAAGRFRYIKRTEGVSTTVLIGRLLSMTTEHLAGAARAPVLTAAAGEGGPTPTALGESSAARATSTPALPALSVLLPTGARFAQFACAPVRDSESRAQALAVAKHVV